MYYILFVVKFKNVMIWYDYRLISILHGVFCFKKEDVYNFQQKFDGYVFVDNKGITKVLQRFWENLSFWIDIEIFVSAVKYNT